MRRVRFFSLHRGRSTPCIFPRILAQIPGSVSHICISLPSLCLCLCVVCVCVGHLPLARPPVPVPCMKLLLSALPLAHLPARFRFALSDV